MSELKYKVGDHVIIGRYGEEEEDGIHFVGKEAIVMMVDDNRLLKDMYPYSVDIIGDKRNTNIFVGKTS
jgi:hypothetical protein